MAEYEAKILHRFTVQGRKVAVTRHAALRYRERVRPTAMHAHAAALDMERIALACGRIRKRPPGWVNPSADGEAADAWLMLGEDIALPLAGEHVISCLTRGTWGDAGRRRRSERRRSRRQQRKADSEQRMRKDLTAGPYRKRMLRQRRERDERAAA